MDLADKIRGYAKKGELVHISIAAKDGLFYANFAAASPAGGYAQGVDEDPVAALEKAFVASPVPRPKPSRPGRTRNPEPEREITATVNDAEAPPSLEQWSTP